MVMTKMNSINMNDTNSETSVTCWEDMDWKYITKVVKNLRYRIFSAKREGNLRKLRLLQKLMMHSSSNVAYSIRHVCANSGSKTPGIDNKLYKSPEEKFELYSLIKNSKFENYTSSAVKRIYIKEGEKMRPIGIPTVYDRVMQMVVKNSLEPEWEAVFEKSSYGFRPNRSVNDAVNRIWLTCSTKNGRTWVVDADISKCFDTTSHKYLLQQLTHFPGRSLIESWLKCGIIVNDIWLDLEEGTPQGSIISPLLCNISLHGLEKELGIFYNPQGFVDTRSNSIIRYADDIVIFCRSKEEAINMKDKLAHALDLRSQEISEMKTKIVHICEGFDFLGFTFQIKPKDGRSEKESIIRMEDDFRFNYDNVGFYVIPSEKSIKKIKTKIKQIFVENHGNKVDNLIMELNPVIRGWAQSKQYWHCNRVFHHLDHHMFNLQWRWIKRAHPNKNNGWLKKTYFKTLVIPMARIYNKWVFFSRENKLNDGERYLLQFKWFKPLRYTLAQIDRCPDNIEDKDYFKKLDYVRSVNKGFNFFRQMDKDIAESQSFTCPICDEFLYNGQKIHLHHIKPRSQGGKDTFSNLIYLHLSCHYFVHLKDNLARYRSLLEMFKQNNPNIRLKEKRKQKRENLRNENAQTNPYGCV